MTIYDFQVKNQNGERISMSQYKGKVLLIVNTATGCGFTPQYTELESLYGCYKDRGFEILDFPCNQFGNQAPGTDEEIRSFCNLKYGVSFPQFAKVDVVGENAEPLFRYLEEHTSFRGFGLSPMGMMLSGVVKKWILTISKTAVSNGTLPNFSLIGREISLNALNQRT